MARLRAGPLALLCALLPALVVADFTNFTLVDGKPHISYIPAHGYGHYIINFAASETESLTVVLTPLSSADPDLYINVDTAGAYSFVRAANCAACARQTRVRTGLTLPPPPHHHQAIQRHSTLTFEAFEATGRT